MSPPPAGCPGVDGGRSGGGRSPRPGPSGQGLRSRSLPVAEPSHSEYGGCSSPTPGVAEDDRSSTFDSLDLDQDDYFRSVLRLVQEFHSFEEHKCSPEPVQDFSCTCLLPPWLWPSFWRTRLYMVSFPFPVDVIESIIGLPPPLSLVCTQSHPAWPRSPSRR